MPSPVTLLRASTALLALLVVGRPLPVGAGGAGNDLDQFMARVLARRDDNWRKLQQYVLDERERADFLGPGRIRLFGLDREYTWYIRDGVFVRSPVKFDGVALSDAERRRAEQEWIDHERSRDKDNAEPGPGHQASDAPPDSSGDGVEALLRATREPQFVSAAYFLRFKFEPGRYAFVGPETYDGRRVLRIEYYPTRLYEEDKGNAKDTKDAKSAKSAKGAKDEDAVEDRITRQLNKVALVTLWVEPGEHQIVQYRFDNVALSFLPGRSLVRVNKFGATMKMGQPFAGVWLPAGIEADGSFTLANGTYDARYTVKYEHYREADVRVRVR
jgi:hypothetical protein